MSRWQNWGRTESATPNRIERPTTERELQSVVTDARERGDTLRVVGSSHSFSPVVPTDDTLVSLSQYTGVVDIDPEAERVTVRAGTMLADLNETLAVHGLAMSNLGDIDRQTVAGALATGTHGTGLDFGVLSSQAVGIRLVTADGKIVECTPDDEDLFRSAQVSLGALGVISEVTLDVEPAYDLCLRRRAVPVDEVLDNLDRFHGEHRNWEFFWFPHTDTALVKTFDRVPPGADRRVEDDGDGALGGLLGDLDAWVENTAWESICKLGSKYPATAPTGAQLAAATLSDKTEVGPSHEVFANPRDVRFRETEYSVPAEDLPAAVRDIRRHIEDNDVSVQFPIECRFVGADDPYLSPAHGRDSGFIAAHIYYQKSLPDYFDACEAIFDEYDGRPHWGKQHSKTAAEFADRYPEWETFQEIRRRHDPEGLFLNDHLQDVLGTEQTVPAVADD